MKFSCPHGCEREQPKSKGHPGSCEAHGETFVYEKALKREAPIRRVSERRAPKARRRGSTLRRGKGFAASPAQREKVRGLPCIFCGREESEYLANDPMHIWPRGKGGCDHELCVVPGCREANGEGCHRLFDEGKLDILPALIDRGYQAEMAHPIAEHGVSPTLLLERLTGQRWQPVEASEVVSARAS